MALAKISETSRFIVSHWTLPEPLGRPRGHTGQSLGNRKLKKK